LTGDSVDARFERDIELSVASYIVSVVFIDLPYFYYKLRPASDLSSDKVEVDKLLDDDLFVLGFIL